MRKFGCKDLDLYMDKRVQKGIHEKLWENGHLNHLLRPSIFVHTRRQRLALIYGFFEYSFTC